MSGRNTLEPGIVPTDVVASMSGLEFLTAIVEGRLPPPPIAAVFDFRLAEVSSGHAVFSGTTSDRLYNPLGSVHGGVAMTCSTRAWDAPCTPHSRRALASRRSKL